MANGKADELAASSISWAAEFYFRREFEFEDRASRWLRVVDRNQRQRRDTFRQIQDNPHQLSGGSAMITSK